MSIDVTLHSLASVKPRSSELQLTGRELITKRYKNDRANGWLTFILGFTITSGILLTPIRIGGEDGFRIARILVVLALPLLLLHNSSEIAGLRAIGVACSLCCLTVLLLIGYGLKHDVVALSGLDRTLSPPINILGMPATFLAGYLMCKSTRARASFSMGLAVGLVGQLIGLASLPPMIVSHGYTRSTGIMGDPNILILHILPCTLVCMALLSETWLALLFSSGLFLGMWWAVLKSLSRAGLFTAVFASVVLIMFLTSSLLSSARARKYITIAIAFVIAVATTQSTRLDFDFVKASTHAFQLRFLEGEQSGGALNDRTNHQNDILNHAGVGLLAPFGLGYEAAVPSTIEDSYLPHNSFLDVLIVSGPIALLLYAGIYVIAIRNLIRRLLVCRIDRCTLMMLLALTGQVLMLCTLSVLSFKVHWLLLGFIYSYGEKAQTSVAA